MLNPRNGKEEEDVFVLIIKIIHTFIQIKLNLLDFKKLTLN